MVQEKDRTPAEVEALREIAQPSLLRNAIPTKSSRAASDCAGRVEATSLYADKV
jgi:hypothetical protein